MASTEFAHAKINLNLHVTGKDSRGYHLIDSLVAFADIGDELHFEHQNSDSFEINGPYGHALNANDNLVLKAKSLFELETGRRVTGQITLTKNLPVASGIGGGSSDAAAMLRLLARETGFSDRITLHKIAQQIGADVPVCLEAKPCRMQGIGEKITPLSNLSGCAVLLINPGKSCPTKAVFERFRMDHASLEIPSLPPLKNFEALVTFLKETSNDLCLAAAELVPEINILTQEVASTKGCALARMSGSGATIFGLFKRDEDARAACSILESTHPDYWCASGRI